MKRFVRWFFACTLLLALLCPAAHAVDRSRSYSFDLSVNGTNEVHAATGDILTVVFTLKRIDSADPYTMYAVQDEIRYDDEFVRPVENGSVVTSGVQHQDIALRDGDRAFYMNYVSFADGEQWSASQIVGTFQLEVLATGGVTTLKNENYLVSLRDGSDSYLASANDLSIIVSSDCTVHFEPNGGTTLDDIIVPYGSLLACPDAPSRSGFTLDGWYADPELTQPWDFETMPVQQNLTLYAKWQEGSSLGWWQRFTNWLGVLLAGVDLSWLDLSKLDLSGVGAWLAKNGAGILLLLLLGLLLLLILLLRRRKRKLIFMVNGGAPIEAIRVKRGDSPKNLPIPVRGYSVFCGWFKNEALTDPWYAGVDKATKRKTRLYAKWL